MPSSIRIIEADLQETDHQRWTVELMNAYAMDPMGDGKPLSDWVRENLIAGLREHPTTIVFLAIKDESPIGIAVCFRGFSTFAARPLINISDYFVMPEYRGQRIGQLLLEAIEAKALQIGCCKLTLEVQEYNQRARSVYAAAGFSQAVYVPEAGGSLFLSRVL
jgi:GNAT superfamily N-acetyltransferase